MAQLNALNPEPVFGTTWMSDRHTSEQFKKGLRKTVVLWDGREYSEKKKEERAKKKEERAGQSHTLPCQIILPRDHDHHDRE